MIPFSPSADVAFVAEPDSAATLAALAGWPDLDTSIGVRSLNGKATKYVELLGRLAVQHGLDGQALGAPGVFATAPKSSGWRTGCAVSGRRWELSGWPRWQPRSICRI